MCFAGSWNMTRVHGINLASASILFSLLSLSLACAFWRKANTDGKLTLWWKANKIAMPNPATPGSTGPTITLEDNAQLYNSWAKTYDTDGNVLQQLDALAFEDTVIPLLTSSLSNPPLKILELGCGTGRNTVLLKKYAPRGSVIYATDISEGMMEEARKKLGELVFNGRGSSVGRTSEGEGGEEETRAKWALIDLTTQQKELVEFLRDANACTTSNTDDTEETYKVDALISTLVLEHVPLNSFFPVLSAVLKPGAWAWVTDMHPEMGASRAAFRNAEGVKVTGVSYMHGIEEKLKAAKACGLEIVGQVDERGVGDEEGEVVRRFGERARKWVGRRMFCGMLFRKGA
ncbi:hypothetical protein CC2G_006300 [Coprinopsis cinerea AmutBmut pab1-1]|nr:hypothetical protein CC2G_006300 [Coprinopsis cinerea AmutBmut pab1-1]